MLLIFFFNDTATTEIYTLSLHDALPILVAMPQPMPPRPAWDAAVHRAQELLGLTPNIAFTAQAVGALAMELDRKSTRLNSSHANISYAVFCLKKKTQLHPYRY